MVVVVVIVVVVGVEMVEVVVAVVVAMVVLVLGVVGWRWLLWMWGVLLWKGCLSWFRLVVAWCAGFCFSSVLVCGCCGRP